MKTLTDWLNYLEKLDPHKIRLGLERIQTVAKVLSLTSFSCPVITVTGTNGKGSTVAFLEAIYLAAGFRVGAYTSPHLFCFNERIRLNGKEVSDQDLITAFASIENARRNVPLTYFEFTTLAALQIFQQNNLDIIILEVGLGGRLDAVNIIDADVAVISSIGIDHTDWLGKDRDSIAREKAGIFRANKMAVYGDNYPPNSIYQIANELETRLYIAERDFFYQKNENVWHWKNNHVELKRLPLPKLACQNAATALMTIDLLQSRLPVNIAAIHSGLQRANIPARFQKIGQCILDVAHNPDAAAFLAQQLQQEPCHGKTLAVVGMLADKDITGTLANLKDCVQEWYVGGLNGARGAPASILVESLRQIDVKRCYNHASVGEAFLAARAASSSEDRIVVFGSFYTVGVCLSYIM